MAPASTSAAAIIGSSPAQASTSPRRQRLLAVGVLQQHELHVLVGEAGLLERPNQKYVWVGAARNGDALALQVGGLGDGDIAARDSAVHSGRE